MWTIELTFTDEPERLAARAAHRRRLASLHGAGTVRMAGPFSDDRGAMIIVEASDRKALEVLVAADPYFATPGVTVTQIREWHPFLQ
jgi:uncharacterized protein YciI